MYNLCVFWKDNFRGHPSPVTSLSLTNSSWMWLHHANMGISFKIALWLSLLALVSPQINSTTSPSETESSGMDSEIGNLTGSGENRTGEEVFSASGRRALSDLVLVDTLCQQLTVLSEACHENKRRLDRWVSGERLKSSGSTQPPPALSSPTPLVVPSSKLGLTSTILNSLQKRGKWLNFFNIFSKVAPLLAKIRKGQVGLDGLRIFLQSGSITDHDFLSTLGLSTIKTLHSLSNLTINMEAKLDQVSVRVASMEKGCLWSVIVTVCLFVFGSVCWIVSNVAEWRRRRQVNRELRRSRRASRMLEGLQRARYQQQQQQVLLA